jgi:hypothetical protein
MTFASSRPQFLPPIGVCTVDDQAVLANLLSEACMENPLAKPHKASSDNPLQLSCEITYQTS